MGHWPLALLALPAVMAAGFLPASAGQVSPVVGEPVPVSAVFDDYGGFNSLGSATDVEVFHMDGRIYGIVAALDDGVQIMDMTDPARPDPVPLAIGSEGFSALPGAYDVEAFHMGGRTYCIVAATGYDRIGAPHHGSVQIIEITDPERPARLSLVFNGSGGFGALADARDVEVFHAGGRTYAITAAPGDDGLQIMDITDPVRPVPVSAIFDDAGGFGALNGATDVEVFRMDGRIYGIVAARDDGVQIMDITDPARPAPVSAAFDGSGGFGVMSKVNGVAVYGVAGRTYGVAVGVGDAVVQTMDITDPERPAPLYAASDGFDGFSFGYGAYDVETYEAGGRAYAVVAAPYDDEVQIIDVTDPERPAPISAVSDGSGGFGALEGARDVAVYGAGGRAYAVAASWYDDGVQIIDVTDPVRPAPASAVFDGSGGFRTLAGAVDAEVFHTDNRTYGMVAAQFVGVQIINITDPARPAPASAVSGYGGFRSGYDAADVEVFNMGGRIYGAVAASYADWVYMLDVTDPVRPTFVSTIFDGPGGFDTLTSMNVEVYETGGHTYGIVAAPYEGWVRVINITDPVRPVPISSMLDDSGGFGALEGAADVEVFHMYGRTYAVVAAADDDGVQIMDITDPVRPVPVSAAFDDTGGFGALEGAADVEVFHMYGRTYAVVAAADDDGVQIMDITDPVRPVPASAAFDDTGGFGALEGAADVEVFRTYGRTYAVVAAADDAGVQIMDVTYPARPAPVSEAFTRSGGFQLLGGAADVKVFHMGGRTYGMVAALNDAGVQIMDVTPPLPLRLDVSVNVTGHERISHGSHDFVRITVDVTNRGPTTLYNDDQDGAVLPGELHVSLNALGVSHPHAAPSCDSARGYCVWSNGEYIAYDDVTRAQADILGAPASEDDCTAWDGWSARHGETAVVKFCYWVDAGFRPESMQFYHTYGGSVLSVPFMERGSCYLPYMLCDESALIFLPQNPRYADSS